jgi:hypothetical protein
VIFRAKTEVEKSGGEFKPFTPHCFRHDAARRFKDILKFHKVRWMLGHVPGERKIHTDDYGPPNDEAIEKIKRKLDLDAIGLSEDKGYTKEQYEAAMLAYGKMWVGTEAQHQARQEREAKKDMLDMVRRITLREKIKRTGNLTVIQSDGTQTQSEFSY